MSVPTNIFELLEDENDTEVKKPATSGSQQQKQKGPANAQPQKKAEAPKSANDGKGKTTQKVDNKPSGNKPRDVGASSQRVESSAPRNKPPRQQQYGDKKEHQQKEESHERQEKPAHRQFDRRSGTGRGKEMKKSGGGRANWGTEDDAQKAVSDQVETEVKEESTNQAEAKVETTDANASTEQKEEVREEEEDNTKTLEEFLGGIKKPVFELPPPRQVAEVKDKKYVPLVRERDEEPQKKVQKEEKKESGKNTIPADQVLKFTSESSPKPFGRGRGRGRGGRDSPRGGRDSPRGGRGGRGGKTGPAPNFKDESSFPSLTATKA